ncbi:MAG: Na+/H+ antiporter subunit E [Paracoccus denitrificans]|nr:MAG: Na+/H+ antiporter subunit E [Paracoccus denitrificans]PZO83201.1 MAG: Na+/H+ antiporter subunit E [Paracoccus denitrificans]
MSILPRPLMSLAIAVFWLLLTSVTPGQIVLAVLIGMFAGYAYSRLTPPKLRIRRPLKIPMFMLRVMGDIITSNYDVARLILSDRYSRRTSSFVRIEIETKEPATLALLAIILTATPGTAWIDYDPRDGHLLMHIFDDSSGRDWAKFVKTRYEAPLKEIFG